MATAAAVRATVSAAGAVGAAAARRAAASEAARGPRRAAAGGGRVGAPLRLVRLAHARAARAQCAGRRAPTGRARRRRAHDLARARPRHSHRARHRLAPRLRALAAAAGRAAGGHLLHAALATRRAAPPEGRGLGAAQPLVVRPRLALRDGAGCTPLAGRAALARGAATLRGKRGAAGRAGQLDGVVMKAAGFEPHAEYMKRLLVSRTDY
mmetsp:Transcript_33718/g.80124  ORF Transcript_33718/g.80124 Transcript_33718/m.80124 type:complete len:210 (-) Transcript_33718:99-728(-)